MILQPRASAFLRLRAFSLIELLVVVAIIAIVAGFVVPAASDMLRGSQMTQASQMVIGQISLARQHAISRNSSFEVRFYHFADPETPGEKATDPATGQFRAFQIFEVLSNGAAFQFDKMQVLPSAIVFAYSGAGSGLSSLIDQDSAGSPARPGPEAPLLPRRIEDDYEFVSFRFLPDGSTDLDPTKNWCVTLIGLIDRLKAPDRPPANFFTVQLDPVSGNLRTFRPNAE